MGKEGTHSRGSFGCETLNNNQFLGLTFLLVSPCFSKCKQMSRVACAQGTLGRAQKVNFPSFKTRRQLRALGIAHNVWGSLGP